MSTVPPEALLYSVLLGVWLGLLFTALEVLHILLAPGRIVTGLLDICFCLVAAAASFLLALAVSSGQLRFFQAGCGILGFWAVYSAVTCPVRPALRRIVRRWDRRQKKTRKQESAVEKFSVRKKRQKKEKDGTECVKFQILSKKIEKKT